MLKNTNKKTLIICETNFPTNSIIYTYKYSRFSFFHIVKLFIKLCYISPSHLFIFI